jgi:hypothetical protein
MAGTKPNQTTIKKGDKLPPRGRSKRTLILESLKESGLLTLPESATSEQVEKAWFARIAEVALNDDHKDSGICKQALLDRGWSKLKPESDPVEFDFSSELTPVENANAILEAASKGFISVDDASKLLNAIKDTISITESTELTKRLEAIEAALKGK